MRVLFLDDMEARHQLARDIAATCDIVLDHAYTAEDAISRLGSSSFDAASLDHDLADDHYSGPYVSPAMGGTAHSGRAVARWIAKHGGPKKVLVHSFNPDGALSMVRTMRDAGIPAQHMPFGPVSFRAWISSL